MAETQQAGDPTVTAKNAITELLAAPLSPDWTVESLAEQLLRAVADQNDEQELVIDVDSAIDGQSRRLLRPLLACLATRCAAEAGTTPNLYGGHLTFIRIGPDGPVLILGQFENRPSTVRVNLARSTPPTNPATRQAPLLADFRAPFAEK